MPRTLDTFEKRPFHRQHSLFVKIDIGSNLRTVEQEPQKLSFPSKLFRVGKFVSGILSLKAHYGKKLPFANVFSCLGRKTPKRSVLSQNCNEKSNLSKTLLAASIPNVLSKIILFG